MGIEEKIDQKKVWAKVFGTLYCQAFYWDIKKKKQKIDFQPWCNEYNPEGVCCLFCRGRISGECKKHCDTAYSHNIESKILGECGFPDKELLREALKKSRTLSWDYHRYSQNTIDFWKKKYGKGKKDSK